MYVYIVRFLPSEYKRVSPFHYLIINLISEKRYSSFALNNYSAGSLPLSANGLLTILPPPLSESIAFGCCHSWQRLLCFPSGYPIGVRHSETSSGYRLPAPCPRLRAVRCAFCTSFSRLWSSPGHLSSVQQVCHCSAVLS